MANHAKQQIREAVAALVTGLTTTASRVYKNRKRPLAANDLPCLMVMNGDDDLVDVYGSPLTECRLFQIKIKAVVKAGDNVDDVLDTISKEVETVLGANPKLGGLVKDIQYASSTSDFDDGSELKIGWSDTVFNIRYEVRRGAPDVLV